MPKLTKRRHFDACSTQLLHIVIVRILHYQTTHWLLVRQCKCEMYSRISRLNKGYHALPHSGFV